MPAKNVLPWLKSLLQIAQWNEIRIYCTLCNIVYLYLFDRIGKVVFYHNKKELPLHCKCFVCKKRRCFSVFKIQKQPMVISTFIYLSLIDYKYFYIVFILFQQLNILEYNHFLLRQQIFICHFHKLFCLVSLSFVTLTSIFL